MAPTARPHAKQNAAPAGSSVSHEQHKSLGHAPGERTGVAEQGGEGRKPVLDVQLAGDGEPALQHRDGVRVVAPKEATDGAAERDGEAVGGGVQEEREGEVLADDGGRLEEALLLGGRRSMRAARIACTVGGTSMASSGWARR